MPSTIIRKMPIRLNYPLHLEQTIILHLPEEWPVKLGSTTIEENSFSYKSNIGYNEKTRTITISYNYQNLRDNVPVAEAKAYIKKQKAIINDLGFQLTSNPDAAKRIKSGGFNWLMLGVLLVVLVAAGFGVYKLYYQYDPPRLTYSPTGLPIGGWLVLVAFGLFFTPLRLISHIINSDTYFNLSLWQEITNAASVSYNPLLAITLGYEIVVNTSTLVYSLLLIALFVNRRTSLPRLIQFFYAGNLVCILFDLALVYRLNQDGCSLGTSVFTSVLACAIWIPYFRVSERVKETFVNHLQEPETEEIVVLEKKENETIAG